MSGGQFIRYRAQGAVRAFPSTDYAAKAAPIRRPLRHARTLRYCHDSCATAMIGTASLGPEREDEDRDPHDRPRRPRADDALSVPALSDASYHHQR